MNEVDDMIDFLIECFIESHEKKWKAERIQQIIEEDKPSTPDQKVA